MSFDLPTLTAAIARHGPVVRVLITRTAGSVPRGAGTAMLAWADGQHGTIGGGALEFLAIKAALGLLDANGTTQSRTIPLGPGLGQCCGGSVSLVWERFTADSLPKTLPYARPLTPSPRPPNLAARQAAMRPGHLPVELDHWLIECAPRPRQPLWIYGAGHVGRALVDVLTPLPTHAITWIDTDATRFPDHIPDNVTPVTATNPAAIVRHAPLNADHLILTYAHDIDLAICHALLGHDFASAGLIGSLTKWARFKGRLAALGHSPARISAIACPIGDPSLGKHPQAIAVGVAAALLKSKAMTATKGAIAGNGVG